LAGCNTAEQAARADAEFCLSAGIAIDNPHYTECRLVAAQLRMQQAAQSRAIFGQALLGFGQNMQRSPTPTCYTSVPPAIGGQTAIMTTTCY